MVELALLPTQHIYDGPGTSWDWVRRFGGISAPAAKLSLLAYVVAFACMALALRWMTSARAPRPCVLAIECQHPASGLNAVPTCESTGRRAQAVTCAL